MESLKSDVLAESEGKEVAIKACRSLNVDAVRETTSMVIPAVKVIDAGELLGDNRLVERGKELARKVDSYTEKEATMLVAHQDTPVVGQANCRIPVLAPSRARMAILGEWEEDVAGLKAIRHVTTCKIPIKIAGQPIMAIVDTGASKSAISKDLLRRVRLLKHIEPQITFYYNADGRKTPSVGCINDVLVTMGKLTTKQSFSVTNALSYDALLGMDFLKTSGAILDLRTNSIRYELDYGLEGVSPLTCDVKASEPESYCVESNSSHTRGQPLSTLLPEEISEESEDMTGSYGAKPLVDELEEGPKVITSMKGEAGTLATYQEEDDETFEIGCIPKKAEELPPLVAVPPGTISTPDEVHIGAELTPEQEQWVRHFDMLGKASYGGVADGYQRFYQLGCTPEAGPLMAFTTHMGLCEPTRSTYENRRTVGMAEVYEPGIT
jgi:hypothetical protein